jgi:hypothetical protein
LRSVANAPLQAPDAPPSTSRAERFTGGLTQLQLELAALLAASDDRAAPRARRA